MSNFIIKKIGIYIEKLAWMTQVKKSRHEAKKVAHNGCLIMFDPSKGTHNLGDEIIANYCRDILNRMWSKSEIVSVSTHEQPSEGELNVIAGAEKKVVCGTNLMTSYYERYSMWKMPIDLYAYNNIVTLGVGWVSYIEEISKTSKYVYRNILSSDMLHSVRDSYTEKKFREMGINNVLNTGCPTLWRLTEEHCRTIPKNKANAVVTTITDYDKNVKKDKRMLDILCECYEDVYVWIQGSEDLDYLKHIIDLSKVNIVDRSVEAYNNILAKDIDYVGTRLHAGIHALNKGKRSIIIAIDNRAIEMGKDFNLPIIMREQLEECLENRIYENVSTDIRIPIENINRWKVQFDK